MDDSNAFTPTRDQNDDDDVLTCNVSDEALEAAAAPTRMFTAMITDCPTILASCCGGRS
jgi:hypothetical protein